MTKCHDSATGRPTTAREPSSTAEPAAQRVGVDEVRERPLSVDLDHRQQLSIPRLERGIPADVDDLELEAELGLDAEQDLPGPLAETTVRRAEEPDDSYG